MPLYQPQISQEELDRALDNVQKKVVVGILERWTESKEVIKFWFPWIDFAQDPDKKIIPILFKPDNLEIFTKKTANSLRPELKDILLTANSCDMRLYEKILLLFEAHFSIINNAAFI
jgi:plasmid replication initiation protein